MNYERTNLYKIYHLLTIKINKIRDINIDESLLYNKSEVNPYDFVAAE